MKSSFKRITIMAIVVMTVFTSCNLSQKINAPQWQEVELSFEAANKYENPFTDVDMWVRFTHSEGEQQIVRPGFWYDGNTWKIRFASPYSQGKWRWESVASDTTDIGLHGVKGELTATSYDGNNELVSKGLLRMSEGRRNVVHANGDPFLMAADTPWALPWRGTVESVTEYAVNRRERGFNTALLMSLCPDRDAQGPRSRTELNGFELAFADLPAGHINQPVPSYFKTLDTLINILVDNGIVPVYQPVFHGFGWKGLNVLGWNMDPAEYARYCRYLVARYGARPAMWLIGADSDGRNKGIKEGGEEVHQWDAYSQPTGLHYSPFDDKLPDWMTNVAEDYQPHMNRSFQDAEWLDFQWCQTGHGGEHLQHKVKLMFENKPIKAVANGEPTYEGIGEASKATNWWQGHEAWMNFTSGGTMGIVYGAGGLWNWKLAAEEEGWPAWADSDISWKEAINLPGSSYIKHFTSSLINLDITDIEPRPDLAQGKQCLAKQGELYIVYLPQGGEVNLEGLTKGLKYSWIDPTTGSKDEPGIVSEVNQHFISPSQIPYVLVVSEK